MYLDRSNADKKDNGNTDSLDDYSLDDVLEIAKFAEEDRRAREAQANQDKDLQKLQEELTLALLQLEAAKENHEPSQYLQHVYDKKNKEYEIALAKKVGEAKAIHSVIDTVPALKKLSSISNGAGPGSFGAIRQGLGDKSKAPSKKENKADGHNQNPANLKGNDSKEFPGFNKEQMAKIRGHVESLPADLKALVNSAIGDEILDDFFSNPVFVLGDSNIYDKNVMLGSLERKKPAMCPKNQDVFFTEEQLISCNTLIKSTEELLDVIDKKDKAVGALNRLKTIKKDKEQAKENKADKGKKPAVQNAQNANAMSEEDNRKKQFIDALEDYYDDLPDKHKILFNMVLRDRVTNVIMLNPVFLPDGYVYDLSTVKTFFEKTKNHCPKSKNNEDQGLCPLNPEKFFTKSYLDKPTECLFVKNVLATLKNKMAQEFAKKAAALQDQLKELESRKALFRS